MDEISSSPDSLKSPREVFAPDPRNRFFVRLNSNGIQDFTIATQHADVAQFELGTSVPEQVRVHFETAKNLYLYSWFVYRFYPVAEHQALACLELGLRDRINTALPKRYWNRPGRKPTLKPLLRFAIDSGLITNQGFRRWHDRVQQRTRDRYAHERHLEMIERNLDQIELDYSQAVPNEQDCAWDYLPILLEALPDIRNSYAHGSTMLHNQVLSTLELVGEILNQLFDSNYKP